MTTPEQSISHHFRTVSTISDHPLFTIAREVQSDSSRFRPRFVVIIPSYAVVFNPVSSPIDHIPPISTLFRDGFSTLPPANPPTITTFPPRFPPIATTSDDVFTIESPFQASFFPCGSYSITIPHDLHTSGALLALDSARCSYLLHIIYKSNLYRFSSCYHSAATDPNQITSHFKKSRPIRTRFDIRSQQFPPGVYHSSPWRLLPLYPASTPRLSPVYQCAGPHRPGTSSKRFVFVLSFAFLCFPSPLRSHRFHPQLLRPFRLDMANDPAGKLALWPNHRRR
jgi:hypothetical protein